MSHLQQVAIETTAMVMAPIIVLTIIISREQRVFNLLIRAQQRLVHLEYYRRRRRQACIVFSAAGGGDGAECCDKH